ncbi:hypothetical protein EOL96_00375 [Candidatus Saccharibacteria bacterium]|nr:hypothetical protein [Candidatus Saccharibacteria bacterium]
MVSKQHKHRTYARHRTVSRRGSFKNTETDGQYLLKLVVIVILGTVWLKFASPVYLVFIPLTGIPIGILFGLLLVRQFEKSQVDRKLWYLVLIIVTILSYFIPAGIVI